MRVLGALVMVGLGLPAVAAAESVDRKPKGTPWIGVRITDRNLSYGGVGVTDVFDDTPASMCGLQAGDEIIGVGLADVHGSEQLITVVKAYDVGDKVTVTYVRGGGVKRCKARLTQKIDDPTELLHRRVVDRAIPPFALRRVSDGTTVDDLAIRGRVTVLALFTTSCDDCATVITDLAEKAVGDLTHVDLLAVSNSDADTIKAYVQRVGLTAEVASDEGDLVAKYLGAQDEVTILVIDHKGVVKFAASGAGPDATHLDSAAFCVSRADRARRKAK
jgi:peroxiredoxin